jgi:uncharacterized membrane protein
LKSKEKNKPHNLKTLTGASHLPGIQHKINSMIRKHIMPQKGKSDDVRWRSNDIHRIEALSDSVFAFAVTLLIVSLEVPKTFHELYDNFFVGMFGFLVGFGFLMLIWHDQYSFFRRYGLHDRLTIFWTAALLFVVLFYIYPTKFLFTYLFSQNHIKVHGVDIKMVETVEEARQMMMLYGLGFMLVYFILWQTYNYALRRSVEIGLTPIEVFITRTHSYRRLIVCVFGLLCILTAYILPAEDCGYAGYLLMFIFPVLYIVGSLRRKRLNKIFTKEDIEAHHDFVHS